MNLTLHPEGVLYEDPTKACTEGWPYARINLRELIEGEGGDELQPVVLGRMAPLEPDEDWIEPYP